jgi:hypothetical protein
MHHGWYILYLAGVVQAEHHPHPEPYLVEHPYFFC